jgi:hypothetical protein
MKERLHAFPSRARSGESQSRRQTELLSRSRAAPEHPDEVRSRRLLLLERTMYRDGLTPFTSVFTVRIRGVLSEPRLRQALAQTQAKHPLLRCVVQDAADGPRFVLLSRPAPIPLRILERSTDLDWAGQARLEWVTPFRPAGDLLIRLVWVRGHGVHELMLVAHHCICDGPSGITLLRDCLAACDEPHRESDPYESLGAMEDLVPEELARDRGFRFRARRRSALLRLALLAKVRGRRVARRTVSPDAMYFHRWQLSPAESQTLIERCQKENVSVLAAVAVAVLRAFREVRGAGALKHAYTMVNARRFMPRMHPEALFGMAPGVEIPIRRLLSPGEMSMSAFWESARTIREDLAVRIDRLGRQYFEYLAALETLHDRYPRLIADTEAATAVRHITFSNLGKLDLPQQYRDFCIEHIYSPLVMVSPSPANTVVLSTFGGAMEFAIISDEVSLPQAQTSAVRERAMAILRLSAAMEAQDAPV